MQPIDPECLSTSVNGGIQPGCYCSAGGNFNLATGCTEVCGCACGTDNMYTANLAYTIATQPYT